MTCLKTKEYSVEKLLTEFNSVDDGYFLYLYNFLPVKLHKLSLLKFKVKHLCIDTTRPPQHL